MAKSSKSNRPSRDDEREERITMEIVVDCYNEHEAWTGWWCHLENRLRFPFTAECVAGQRGSPLRAGERMKAIALFDDDGEAFQELAEMQVKVKWRGRTLAVPLAQLRGVDVSEEAAEAIADWHYWVAQGRGF